MAKYGMPYQGSKQRIADEIVHILPEGRRFVDLFGGGAAITECALLSGKWEQVLYNELNPLVVDLFKKAISGGFNLSVFKPEFVTREEFAAKKDTDGYIAFCYSFGNNPRKCYMYSQALEPIKHALHDFAVFGRKTGIIAERFNDIDLYIPESITDTKKRRMALRKYMRMKGAERQTTDLETLERVQSLERLERLERLEHLEISNSSYTEYEYRSGDVVYCDPPYEGTEHYEDRFNHAAFYEWVFSRPFQVWFSSYEIADNRFRKVWERRKQCLLSGARKQSIRLECLYTNK